MSESQSREATASQSPVSKASNYARAVRTAVMLSMSLTEAPGPEAGYTHDDYDEAMAGIDWFVRQVAEVEAERDAAWTAAYSRERELQEAEATVARLRAEVAVQEALDA